MKPKISILIPTYNQPQYIIQAVESALLQDYFNLEVIVNDDSTNNETEQLLKPFFADKRFSYYKTKTNIGRVGNYRQLLYEYASGDWVVMLDGDDYYIDSHYISYVVSFILKYPKLVFVGAGHKIYYECTGETTVCHITDEDKVFDGSNIFKEQIPIPQHTTNVYKREVALPLNCYNHPSNASDAEGLYRLCLHGEVAFLHLIPVVWRIHENNTTYTKDISEQIAELNFIDSVYHYSLSFLESDIAKAWQKRQYYGHSHHILQIALNSKKFTNVLKVCYHFRKYWGIKSLPHVIYRYLKMHATELPFLQKCLLSFLTFIKKVLK